MNRHLTMAGVSVGLLALTLLPAHAVEAPTAVPFHTRLVAAQNARSVPMLDDLGTEVESLWPANPRDYFEQERDLGTVLNSVSAINPQVEPLVAKYGRLALEKPAPDDFDLRLHCLMMRREWVHQISRAAYFAPDLPMAQLLAKVLGDVRSSILTNYSPVAGGTNAVPVADDYRKALVGNNRTESAKLLLQMALPGMNDAITPDLNSYCYELFKRFPETRNQQAELGRLARLTAAEADRLGSPTTAQRIAAAQADGSLSNLVALAAEIEGSWPERPLEYFQSLDQLGGALDAMARTNAAARPGVYQAGGLILEKSCLGEPIARYGSFEAKRNWVRRFAQADYLKPDLMTAKLLAKTINEAESAIIPNYQPGRSAMPSPPIMPTNPPQGTRNGMLVDSIIDPIAREAWKKAIAEAKLARDNNALQQWLPGLVKDMKAAYSSYCAAWIHQDPDATKLLNEVNQPRN